MTFSKENNTINQTTLSGFRVSLRRNLNAISSFITNLVYQQEDVILVKSRVKPTRFLAVRVQDQPGSIDPLPPIGFSPTGYDE